MLEASTVARDPLLTISNGMVRLYKEAFGRGPRRARTSFAGADSLVIVLEQTLTTAERNLVELGQPQQLHEARLIIQAALEPRARALVEGVVRRRTLAYATGLDTREDVAVVFLTLGAPVPASKNSDGRAALAAGG